MTPSYDLLKTFIAAAEAQSFAEAATRERVTVSAISQKIRALEAQMGQPLFERIGRRVRLSASGQRLLDAVRESFSSIDDAVSSVRADFTDVRGNVYIGGPRAFCAHWLRPRAHALLLAHEGLRLVLEYGVRSELERRLLARELDFAVLTQDKSAPGIEAVAIATEAFVAIASPAYLKRWGTPRTHADFVAHRWAGFDRDLAMHTPWWRSAFGRSAAQTDNWVCCAANLDELLAIAESGLAIVVLPSYFVATSLKEKRVRILEPEHKHKAYRVAQNTLYLAWRRSAVLSARFCVVRDGLLAANSR